MTGDQNKHINHTAQEYWTNDFIKIGKDRQYAQHAQPKNAEHVGQSAPVCALLLEFTGRPGLQEHE